MQIAIVSAVVAQNAAPSSVASSVEVDRTLTPYAVDAPSRGSRQLLIDSAFLYVSEADELGRRGRLNRHGYLLEPSATILMCR